MLIGDNGEAGQMNVSPELLIKDSDTKNFASDVIEVSKEVPVIVDFWAPWCGPCKQLGPALEKLVKEYSGKVRLVKINVDENQPLAMQLQVQSIPAVFAFKDGRPADGFVGAVPESKLRNFIDKLTGGGGSPLDEAVLEAEELVGQEQYEQALVIYQRVLEEDQNNIKAVAGVLKCYMELGKDDVAKEVLGRMPEEMARNPEIGTIRAALELKEATQDSGSAEHIQVLRDKIIAEPKDMQGRLDLAMAFFGAKEHESAVDELLEMIRMDRNWQDEAARKQLVKFFEAFGPTDPLTVDGRRRLSSILFA